MAKFCGNCGAKMDETARVCGKCGVPCAENMVKNKIPGVGDVKIKNKSNILKMIKRIFIVCVVLIILSMGIRVIIEFTGYRGILRKTMTAYEKYDMNTLISLASEIAFCGDENIDIEDYYADVVADKLEQYESEVGHNLKFSYEVKETYEISKVKYEELLGSIEEIYDYDTSDIAKIMAVEMDIMAEGNKGSATYNSNGLYLLKENGKWKIYYPQIITY